MAVEGKRVQDISHATKLCESNGYSVVRDLLGWLEK